MGWQRHRERSGGPRASACASCPRVTARARRIVFFHAVVIVAMATVSLLFLVLAAAAHITIADENLLDLSLRGLTTIDIPTNLTTCLTLNLSGNAIVSWGTHPFRTLHNVTVIDLSRNQLRIVDPVALSDVPGVRELNLSDNAVESLAGRPFRALLNLVQLDLSDNKLETLEGSSLGDLVQLQFLNLRGNALASIADADLRGLARLQWLDLSNNAIHSAAAGALRGLNGLGELSAGDNPDVGSIVVVGRRLQRVSMPRAGLTAVPASLTRSVRTLNLPGNRLTGIACGDLDSYPLLRELDLSSNRLDAVEDDALGRLEQLSVLRLSDNRLLVVPPGLPAGLVSLELHQNRIKSVTALDWQGLQHLRELSLSGNQLRQFPAGAFRPLESLETLDLSANPLAALPAEVLEGLSRLRSLRLTGLTGLVRPASWLPFPAASVRLTFLDISGSPVLADQLLADTAALTAMRQLAELRIKDDGLSELRQDLPSLLGRLRRLRLSGNALNCSESVIPWLSSWIVSLDTDDVRCVSPDSLHGRSLSSLRSSDPVPNATTKFNSDLTITSPLVSTSQSTTSLPTSLPTPTSLPNSTSERSQTVHRNIIKVVEENLTTLTPVSASSTIRNTTLSSYLPSLSSSTTPPVTSPTSVSDLVHEESISTSTPTLTEGHHSSRSLTSTRAQMHDKILQVSQLANLTIARSSTADSLTTLMTEQHATTAEPLSGTHSGDMSHVRVPLPSREALSAERPVSKSSSLLALFGVGAVGSALVLLVLAAAQATPRPRLDLSNNSRSEPTEEYDENRAELW